MDGSSATMPAPRSVGRPDGRPVAPVVPRWEYRWMDRTLPVDPARAERWRAAPVSVTGETYLVSFRTPHNAKIRGGELDLKRLERISEDGIERWTPVLKTTFPLDAAAFREVCGAWGVPVPGPDRAPRTLADLSRFVDAQPDLRRVELVKRRRRVERMPCPGEFVEIAVADRHWVSLAFESEDPELVRAVLVQLGLDPRQNLNYPAALRRLFLRPRPQVQAAEGAFP